MKLFYKIYLFLMAGILLMLAIDGYLSFRSEVFQMNVDMQDDAVLMGRVLSGMIRHTWKKDGEAKAIELIKGVNHTENRIKLRWVWLETSDKTNCPPKVRLEKVAGAIKGEITTVKVERNGDEGYQYTYFPVTVDSQRRGALELVQSLKQLKEHVHKTLKRALIHAGLLLLVSGFLLYTLFNRLIGKPLNQLSEKAIRIGEGDLHPDLHIKGRDELSNLAAAMNTMCERLSTAQEAVRDGKQKTHPRHRTVAPRRATGHTGNTFRRSGP